MYILKNAWRSISRAKVRNILIGVIVRAEGKFWKRRNAK